MAGARTSRLNKLYLLYSKQYSQARTYSSISHDATLSTRSRLTSRRVLTGCLLGSLIAAGAYVGTSDEATISTWSFEASKYLNPLFRLLDPEDAHKLAIFAASHGLAPRESRTDPPILHVKVWGREFPNPIGLAAGFDKDAEAMEGLLGMGLGFVEVGSITPLPQEGNPKPRVFRLPEQGAIINRYGFNSQGIMAVAKRLGALHGKKRLAESVQATPAATSQPLSSLGQGNHNKISSRSYSGLLGVNLGKNKSTEDAASDYVKGVHTLSTYADYLVINVSSPNTPGLRKLQGRKQLKNLIKKVIEARDEMQWGERGPPPLLVKIAPDLSKQDLADIAAVALTLQLDGLIISNTTVSRPDSVVGLPHAEEIGGLSGKPLYKLSTEVLQQMYRLTKGKVTLIGCGGVSSGEDAYMKIRSGASLVQLYTALVYEGPAVIPRIKKELAACLERDGFKTVQDAVGVDCR